VGVGGFSDKERELMAAAKEGDVRRVTVLLDGPSPPRVNARQHVTHPTALTVAVKHGHLAVTRALLARGADANSRTANKGVTPLLIAARDGDAGLVKVLLAKGARVDDQDSRGSTALMLAASRDHVEVMRLLLAKGADLMFRDPTGLTVDDFARSPATRAVLQVGINHGPITHHPSSRKQGSTYRPLVCVESSSRHACALTVGARRPRASSPPSASENALPWG
jgi:uncharacterized protein